MQIDINTGSQTRLQEIVRSAFLRSAMLQMATLPTAMTQALFNRYDVGMTYGPHVDAPVMGGVGNAVRSDVAITVFLSDPKTYAGGDLVVDSHGMEYGFKLDAGSAIAYPANSLHHVTPVTQGARYAAVIWVQSTGTRCRQTRTAVGSGQCQKTDLQPRRQKRNVRHHQQVARKPAAYVGGRLKPSFALASMLVHPRG